VFQLRRRLEDGVPIAQLDQLAVKGVGHVRVGQVAFEQGRHHLKAGLALYLMQLGQTGMPSAPVEPALSHLLQPRLPGVQRGLRRVLVRHEDLK